MGFVSEFKEFALKGNVVDLAVGVIIGGAFGKIVTSLVNDVIMPAVGVVVGGVNFADLAFVLKEKEGDAAAVVVKYGSFLQTVFDFTIVALVIFTVVKAMNNLKKAEPVKEAAAPALTKDQELLTEIKHLLSHK